MMIRGKVKFVSPDYPYLVEMQNGKTFTSHFKFSEGMTIRLHLSGNLFSHETTTDKCWPAGFVLCRPNGLRTFPAISEQRIKASKDPKAEHWQHCLPFYVRKAIHEGPQKWSTVEGFYRYYYTCTFDPATRQITTNYAFHYI